MMSGTERILAYGAGEAEANLARRRGVVTADFVPRDGKFIDDRARMAQQDLARLGWRHAAWTAKQKRGAEFSLHVAHVKAQRRLRDVERGGSFRKRPLLDDRQEITQLS